MSRSGRSWLLLMALIAVVASLAASGPAAADTRLVRAAGFTHGKLVFKVRGIRSGELHSARLHVGRRKRSLSVRRVRREVSRGVVRAVPRSLRKQLRGAAGRQTRRRMARRAARGARLGLTTRKIRSVARPVARPVARRQIRRNMCSVPADARFVSPAGSDANPGTVDRPWYTIEKAEAEAAPGTTIVLRGGTYGALGRTTWLRKSGTRAAPIFVTAYPGEVPAFRGHVEVEGNHRRLCGLLFDGPTGQINEPTAENPKGQEGKVWITGNDVTLANSEVRGSQWHAGVYIDGGVGTRLVGNYIHDNGRFGDSSHANLDHGIYWSSGSGLIEGNRIENNYANAVSLYPNASDVTVRGNTMTGHGRAAVLITEDCANNTIVGNAIYGNRKGIQGWNLRGRGNLVVANRVRNNAEGDLVDLDGVTLLANTQF